MSQPTHDHDIAWESTTVGYDRYVTDERYQKFSDAVKRWYKPYRCSHCEELRTRAEAAEKRCRDLEMQLIAAKPLYSRRQLEKRCEELERLAKPMAMIAPVILAEAPHDATTVALFIDCEGTHHVVSLDYLREVAALSTSKGES